MMWSFPAMNVMFGSTFSTMRTNPAQHVFTAHKDPGQVLFGCSQDEVSFGKRGGQNGPDDTDRPGPRPNGNGGNQATEVSFGKRGGGEEGSRPDKPPQPGD